ncbi:hypothetical protein NXS15_00135 [Mycoplasma sp. CSL7475-4]|uniref:MSC_0624 family F1-like ATPase-associated membrane protein n=1 Tax=Mycoplasma sp. CSL7475-4 TaxID=2973942 RepID=UPI00216B3894|nr:hypothetical protein [Mycoplasma sp. CSL7475-4]MCS4536541.1 hypothetical protein [Mycoplasma sp. CSL7475-4]
MLDTKIDNKRVYDDYQSLLNKQKRNISTKIYQWVLISLLFITTLLLFLFADKTLLSIEIIEKISGVKNNYGIYFNSTNASYKEINAIVFIRMTLLLFVFIYPFSKAFGDLRLNKEKVQYYWPWFISYTLISLTAFFLLFFFHSFITKDTFIATSVLLLVTFLSDFTHSIFNFYLKRKSDPINGGNRNILIISQVFKFALFIIAITIFFAWSSSGKLLLQDNKFANWFKDLFEVKKAANLAIIIALFVGFSLVFFFAIYDKINILILKQYSKEYLKQKLLFNLIILFALLLWSIRIMTLLKTTRNIFDEEVKTNNYLSLLFILVPVLLFVTYFVINVIPKFRNKGILMNTLIFASFNTILWLAFAIFSLKSTDTKINLIVLFSSIISSLIILAIFMYKNYSPAKTSIIFIILLTIISVIVLSIFSFSQLLISNGNNELSFINSSLSIPQIFAIIQVSISIAFLIAAIAQFWIVIFKINNAKSIYKNEVKDEK